MFTMVEGNYQPVFIQSSRNATLIWHTDLGFNELRIYFEYVDIHTIKSNLFATNDSDGSLV